MENRRVILFTQDTNLTNIFLDTLPQGSVEAYLFDKPLEEIDLNNSVVVLDYDNEEGLDTAEFLSQLVKCCGTDNKVIVISKDCDRRNVADVAKRGAERFIVKPVNKKRLKRSILPYVGTTQVMTEVVQ